MNPQLKSDKLTSSITKKVEKIFNSYQLNRKLFNHKYFPILTQAFRESDGVIVAMFELLGQRGELDEDINENFNLYGRIHLRLKLRELIDLLCTSSLKQIPKIDYLVRNPKFFDFVAFWVKGLRGLRFLGLRLGFEWVFIDFLVV